MTRIHILPSALADKIAAGEVVERPASVVKELVENAIDAGATHIRVDINKAGRERIQVADNGSGMTLEEAQLSIQRHATSKIRDEVDLFCIRTLGFRGEALPSIAAVSHLILETKSKEASLPEGARVVVQGSEVMETQSVGCPVGTKVEARNLFYNTPARLKFLKSDGVELGHIEDTLVRLALSRTDCAFDFYVDGTKKLSAVVSKNPLQRIGDVLGKSFSEDLIEVCAENPDLQVTGWVVHPRQTASNANSIYFYLNGRFLKDRVLQHALSEGFGDFLMKGRYPKGVLYLRMNPSLFDVNVHPSKREVRFVNGQAVHQFVAKAVKKVLQQSIYSSGETTQSAPPDWASEKTRLDLGRPKSPAPLSAILVSDPGCENRLTQAFQKPNLAAPFETPYRYRELKVLGSFLSTYIVCESFDGRLVLIDQHAAHERIGYEKLKKNFVGRTPSQTLLIPLTWEATTQQAAVLISHLPRLKEAGLEMEPFGGNTFVVKAVPLLLAEAKIPSVLEKLTEELEQRDDSRALEETLEHVLKTMACHAQVRAKDKLSIPEMEHLLVEMDLFQATHCPHGRPTSVEVTLGQIEGWFKRT